MKSVSNILLGDFIKRIYLERNAYEGEKLSGEITDGEYVRRAVSEGWAESIDLTEMDNPVERRTAARLIHEYIRNVLGISDIPDISSASALKDLYDCRTCVNHIAQVFLRGIIDPRKIPGENKSFLIFDGRATLSEEEADAILGRVFSIS